MTDTNTPTSRAVWVVSGTEGADFVSDNESIAQDRATYVANEFPDFGPWTLTEYVPKRDLAAAQEALRRATTPVANVTLSGDAQYWQDRAQRAEALAEKIKQILLPDPHDERDVSAEWQVKAIHAAIDKAREGK